MVKAGKLTTDYLQGEIGEVFDGKIPGRNSADQITFYRSLGIAAQDLATAHYVLEKANKNGLGVEVSF